MPRLLGMQRDSAGVHLDLLLLSVLADRPAHGYLAISSLRERSGGVFDLPEGTVYPALHRLERQGLLASDWEDVAGRRRRVYRITAAGRDALAAEREQWQSFARGVSTLVRWAT